MPVTDLMIQAMQQSMETAVSTANKYYDDQLNALGEELTSQINENLGKPVRAIPLKIFKKKEIPIIRVPDKNATMTVKVGKKRSLKHEKFILTSVSRGRQEQYQLFQTFGDYIVDFYGESPQIYSFSGTVVAKAGEGGNWLKELEGYYRNNIRGQRLAGRGYMVEIHYATVTVIGYAIGLSISESQESGDIAQFSITVLVRDTIYDPEIKIVERAQ